MVEDVGLLQDMYAAIVPSRNPKILHSLYPHNPGASRYNNIASCIRKSLEKYEQKGIGSSGELSHEP